MCVVCGLAPFAWHGPLTVPVRRAPSTSTPAPGLARASPATLAASAPRTLGLSLWGATSPRSRPSSPTQGLLSDHTLRRPGPRFMLHFLSPTAGLAPFPPAAAPRPPCAACCPVCLLFTVPAAAHGSSGMGTLSCLEQGRCPGTVEQISDRWTVRCDTKAGRSGASFSARPRSEAPQAAKSGVPRGVGAAQVRGGERLELRLPVRSPGDLKT